MKELKRILISAFVLGLIMLQVIQCFAETGFTYNGITYANITDDTVRVFDFDNSNTELIIPDKAESCYVTEVGNYALQNNEYITKLNIDHAIHLVKIGEMSFNGCSNISGDLFLPSRITSIGMGAFQSCNSLTSVNYSAKTGTIAEQCFNRCSSLETVKIGSGNKTIDKYAFANCPMLNSVTIPKSVNSIDPTAFDGCGEFVIKGYRGSYAQQFAKDKGLDFYILDPLYGDSNADGKVNILDVTAIQKYKIGEQELSEYGMRCADVNHDGSITVRDATLIQMKLAKYDVDF